MSTNIVLLQMASLLKTNFTDEIIFFLTCTSENSFYPQQHIYSSYVMLILKHILFTFFFSHSLHLFWEVLQYNFPCDLLVKIFLMLIFHKTCKVQPHQVYYIFPMCVFLSCLSTVISHGTVCNSVFLQDNHPHESRCNENLKSGIADWAGTSWWISLELWAAGIFLFTDHTPTKKMRVAGEIVWSWGQLEHYFLPVLHCKVLCTFCTLFFYSFFGY